MKKKLVKFLAMGLALTMGLAACGNSDAGTGSSGANGGGDAVNPEDLGSGTITVWVAEAVSDWTQQEANKFMQDNGYQYTVVVEPVGEGDAASQVITDVEAGADLYGFAPDQLARLIGAGALQQLSGTGYDTWISEQNSASSVETAKTGDTLYAFPMTGDNGYFLFYDKSVVTDPSTLEGIVADCEAAGKNFYMEVNSGWYDVAFFFGTGCELTFDTDDSGAFTNCNINYASEEGVVALKEIIELVSSKSFQNGSTVDKAIDWAAIVTGTWDAGAAKDYLGDNYACAKLPTFTGSDGKSYQMGGFTGYKLLGVKPQTEAGKLRVCLELAKYLTNEEAQLARFEKFNWGPCNTAAQASDAVQSDPALAALFEQMQYMINQGQYPNEYWSDATALGDTIITGEAINSSTSEADLMKVLEDFTTKQKSYAGQ